MRYFRSKNQSRLRLFCLSTFYFCLCVNACSVPNLEKPECTEAREAIKQFYSFHFGNDMTPSEENLKLRERFLTKDLFAHLWSRTGAPKDYFTETENFPKAFRIGTCEAVSPDKTIFQVVLLWRDDEKNVQREAKVEMLRQDGKWLVNKVLDQ